MLTLHRTVFRLRGIDHDIVWLDDANAAVVLAEFFRSGFFWSGRPRTTHVRLWPVFA
jgi:hypothetical protein